MFLSTCAGRAVEVQLTAVEIEMFGGVVVDVVQIHRAFEEGAHLSGNGIDLASDLEFSRSSLREMAATVFSNFRAIRRLL